MSEIAEASSSEKVISTNTVLIGKPLTHYPQTIYHTAAHVEVGVSAESVGEYITSLNSSYKILKCGVNRWGQRFVDVGGIESVGDVVCSISRHFNRAKIRPITVTEAGQLSTRNSTFKFAGLELMEIVERIEAGIRREAIKGERSYILVLREKEHPRIINILLDTLSDYYPGFCISVGNDNLLNRTEVRISWYVTARSRN